MTGEFPTPSRHSGKRNKAKLAAANVLAIAAKGYGVALFGGTDLSNLSSSFANKNVNAAAIRPAPPLAPLRAAAYKVDGITLLADGLLAVADNQVDTTSGSIRIKARFDNADGKLWPGQSVETRLTVKVLPNVVAIPDAAVQRGPTGPFAYVVNQNNKAELKKLVVGQIQRGTAVILSGISVGDTVVTSGHYKLQPGTAVQIVNPKQQSTAGSPTEKAFE